ncbi:MAG: aldose 1-epimerase family protein [Hansschlegelia sp.]
MGATHQIGSGRLKATVAAHGAELISLRDGGGELLWQAGPEWPRHAPVLFPIVGRLSGDALRVGGETFRLTQHGFARDQEFLWTERGEDRALLSLTDNVATRALYPFAFRLELDYRVEGDALSVTARVSNPGGDVLPFCVGAHPGFRWPLVDDVAKEDHALEFEAHEPGPARSVEGGLLGPDKPLPFDGRTLALTPELFSNDALVMPDVKSRSVRYSALRDGEAVRTLTVSWRGYDDLGVWSAPLGAPFLCIEPWRGMASSVGWDGPFMDKPGVVRLEPGATMEFEWRVEV